MRSLCLVLILLSINSVYADTLIHAGQLVDVAAGDVLSEQTMQRIFNVFQCRFINR